MRQTPEKLKELMLAVKKKLHLKQTVIALSAVMVFVTTYLLVLPAFTLDREEAIEQGGIDIVAVETEAEKAEAEAASDDASDDASDAEAAKADAEKSTETPAKADKAKDADKASKSSKASGSEKAKAANLTSETTLTAEKSEKDDYTISAVVNKDAEIPSDAKLQATELKKSDDDFDYKKYYDDALEALKAESDTVKSIRNIRFYDISLESESLDEAVEPAAPVNVKIEYEKGMKVDDADSVRIVHFAEQKNGKVKAEVLDEKENKVEAVVDKKESTLTEASFETDGFSVYAIVGTETIETTYITAEGETYKITVNYTSEAEIPNGSELEVREILRGSEEYNSYRSQTEDALGLNNVAEIEEEADEEETAEGEELQEVSFNVIEEIQPELTFIRLFDISIKHGEEKIEPKVPVEVVITYVEPVDTENNGSLDVVHFTDDGTEVIENVSVSDDGTQITYGAESFSVYGTAQSTVGNGSYIIYRTNNNYALSYTNGTLGRQSVTVGGGRVTSTNDNVVYTFTAVSGGYQISYTYNGTTYYLRDNNGTLNGTTNSNQASVWNYSNNNLYTRTGSTTRYLRYSNSAFSLGTNNSGRTIYLAKLADPVTITIHYVNESGEEILVSQRLEDSTSSGVTAIKDIVQPVAGYTYHNTYLNSTSGTQIVPELRGAGGGTWEYQVYGQETYTQFSSNTDIYVVYGGAYGSNSSSGSGSGSGDELSIETPEAGKVVMPNTDGTFNLSLTITGEGASGGSSKGANVILVLDTSNSMNGNVSTGGTRFTNAVSAAQDVATKLLSNNSPEYPGLVEMCLVEFNWDIATSNWYTAADYSPISQDATYDASTAYYTKSGSTYTAATVTADTFEELKNDLYVATSSANNFKNVISDASRNSGTNWEGALQAAIAAANAKNDGDDTYIIFLTDGNPSAYTGTNNGNGRYDREADTTTTSSHYFRIEKNYMRATDEARQIVQNGWKFYTVGMYGNVDVLNYLTNFAYYGRSVNQTENKDTNGTYYYPAAETSTLISALNNIADAINNSLALAGVDFKDGIAQDVTHTALSTNVSGSLGGVTYTKAGGTSASYTVTVDSDGKATFKFGTTTVTGTITTVEYDKITTDSDGKATTSKETASVYAATYNGTTYYMPIATVSESGDFEWDLSPLGTLEKNGKYTVTFKVWPDQDAYDYVTNLNNGISGYTWDETNAEAVYGSDGTTVKYYRNGVSKYPNIVKYPNGTYAAMSNTYQTVDYYIANTEETSSGTTTTYEKGVPVDLDVPDPMVLTGSNFTVTKKWSDDLDPTQLQKLIEAAEAAGNTYSITLKLKEDGESYKSYTFSPVKNEETGVYEWPSQTINIAPALLTTTYPGGGTYNTVTIDGDTYYILNNGHEYLLEEDGIDSHFEFVTENYHPALVNGVLKNVKFDLDSKGNIKNGSTGNVVGDVPLTTFMGNNTLKGGINIYKKVVDVNGEAVSNDDSTFKVRVSLDDVPEKQGSQIWFDTYEVDKNGEIIVPTEAELTHWINTSTGVVSETEEGAGSGYVSKVQVIDAKKGIYKAANGSLYGVNGKTIIYDDETNYLGSGGYGNTSRYTNILDIKNNWMIRIVNVLAGTTYDATETQTNGMVASYEHWHDNADSTEKIVIGNASGNIRITNKIVNQKVIVYKTDTGTTPLSGATFTINGTTLTSGDDGYTAVIELPTSGTAYDLVETVAPDGYNLLSDSVKVTVSSSGVSYMQADYNSGAPQTAEKDANGNYVVQVRDNAGVELPHTGGSGTLLYTLSGIALMLGAALMYGFRLRRRERRLKN